MQRKIVLIAAASFLATSIASAQEIKVNTNINANTDINANANMGANTNINANANLGADKVKMEATLTGNSNIRGNATSSAKKSDKATTTSNSPSSASTSSNHSTTAEAHMSAVAKFVQSLLAVADREGGIGVQVRAVAQAQNDTATTTASSIINIEKRGKFRTFLFGTDYKSIGQLRSDLSVTENNIVQLKSIIEKTTSTTGKVELAAQVKVLEDTQVKMNTYIKAHEDIFSLFGWFNK